MLRITLFTSIWNATFQHYELNKMNSTVKELKKFISESCVTIILNTRRTKPDNIQDGLNLINKVLV